MNNPLSLRQLQERFRECLFDADMQASRLPLVETKGLTNERRINIYRNNVFYSLQNALAELYPVINRLTGDEFFKGAGLAFLKQYPPDEAAMVNFASQFPQFLEEYNYASGHRWLADVARLELAWHQAYHEVDSRALTAEELMKIPSELLANSGLKLHPSVRLLSSPYPVLKIWLANQEDNSSDETISLDSGGETICIYRPAYEVRLRLLDRGSYEFLRQLDNGRSLEKAIFAASDAEPDFTADIFLSECLSDGLFEKLQEA